MRVRVFGPFSGYGPGEHPNRVMLSWSPNEVVEVDDSDAAAVAFYTRFVDNGVAERIDDDSESPVGAGAEAGPASPAAEPEPAPVPTDGLVTIGGDDLEALDLDTLREVYEDTTGEVPDQRWRETRLRTEIRSAREETQT